MKCVYNPLAQLFTIMLLTGDAGPYGIILKLCVPTNQNLKNYHVSKQQRSFGKLFQKTREFTKGAIVCVFMETF